MNKFIGLGNLTRDPNFREIKGDNKVCDFAIAINNKASNSVFYIDIETWNKVAENCNRFLSKGRKGDDRNFCGAALTIELQFSAWNDRAFMCLCFLH